MPHVKGFILVGFQLNLLFIYFAASVVIHSCQTHETITILPFFLMKTINFPAIFFVKIKFTISCFAFLSVLLLPALNTISKVASGLLVHKKNLSYSLLCTLLLLAAYCVCKGSDVRSVDTYCSHVILTLALSN